MQVCSYNILSCAHVKRDSSDPEISSVEYRWKLLKEKLTKKVQESAIICLQEVCQTWMELLLPFFTEMKYETRSVSYGNGNMGLITAVPSTTFTIQDSIEIKPASVLRGWAGIQFVDGNKFWQEAMKRTNRSIILTLEAKNVVFQVCNYHMPRACPAIIASHFSVLAHALFSTGLPFIFVGDFNTGLNSDVYGWITEGKHAVSDIAFIPNVALPELVCPLKSAYAEIKIEQVKSGANKAIDYLFYHGLNVAFTDPVSSPEPCPNKDEPSDHLLVSATFRFNKIKTYVNVSYIPTFDQSGLFVPMYV